MALVLQSANLVRQKTFMINRSPGVFYALKSLFLHLAANKGNPDLKIVFVDGTATASDGGNVLSQVVSDSACTLYAIVIKKSGATLTSFKVSDSATTAATDGTQAISTNITTLADEYVYLYPTGKAMANGLTYTETITGGTTATQNVKANAVYGFIIVGA